MPRELKLVVSEICSLLDIDGIRGDITVNRAARALAAFESRLQVELSDVQRVLGLSLNHRCACWASAMCVLCGNIMTKEY